MKQRTGLTVLPSVKITHVSVYRNDFQIHRDFILTPFNARLSVTSVSLRIKCNH